MSPYGYEHGVSSCVYVDTDMESLPMDMDMECLHVSTWIWAIVSPCLHVDMDTEYLHVSMWIWKWSVSMCFSMSPCGYGHGVSPCVYVDMEMECLHVSM